MRFSRRGGPSRRGSGWSFDTVIDQARAGDHDAVTDLYLDHVAMVHGYLTACGVSEPDDLTSEVFAGMLRGLDRFEGGQPEFRRWLMTIAHRRLVDQRRRWFRDRIDLAEPHKLETAGSARLVTDLHVREIDPELVAGFFELTEAQREVLALRFVADLSLVEVSEVTDRPVGAVKSLQSRGLAALRKRVPDPTAPQGAMP
jgi:RNA polymerase sigma-70 factor (ECF subfamily)